MLAAYRPTFPDLDHPSTEPDPMCQFLVTLINGRTGHEVSFEIQTRTDKFTDVMLEINHQKAVRGLKGYTVFECIDLTPCPF